MVEEGAEDETEDMFKEDLRVIMVLECQMMLLGCVFFFLFLALLTFTSVSN